MNKWSNTIVIGFAALVAGAAATVAVTSHTPVSTTEVSLKDRAAIERIVHDYIMEHPEILPEAMEHLRDREVTKAVNASRSVIETPFAGGWEGSATPDVTLVEFFDYACGYCRASIPVIDRLLKEDPKLRIVYREFPVLGPDSEAAAKVSLAAAKADKYGTFHRALFAQGRPEPRAVSTVAKQLGIDTSFGNSAEATRELANNMELQRSLNLTGTPSWVVGNKVLSGAVGYDALKAAIAEARARKS
jgi:protein-disulfide isomerase